MIDHPTGEQLWLYLTQDGSLATEQLGEIESHVETCQKCQGTLEAMTPDLPEALGRVADVNPLADPQDLGEPGSAATRETVLETETIERDEIREWFLGHPELFSGPAISGDVARQPDVPGPLGRFWLEEELGSGGFGVVYRARDLLMECEVAVKIPLRKNIEKPETRRWFLQEAQNAYGLNAHKNVVKVVHFGEEGGFPYIVSEYCAGGSLAKWLDGQSNPVPFRLTARIVAELAEGVAHAHEGGLLHRDLKLENVLLQPGPKAESDGFDLVPRLVDFGLARRMGGDDPIGDTLHGTLGCTPPEQLGGRAAEISARADVYGLGVLLYHLLTRRLPFIGSDRSAVIEQIRTTPPEPVRALRPDVPRDLARIVERCLEKVPADRYASAAELGGQLRRFIKGEPIPDSPRWKYARAWLRESPVRAVGVAAVAVVLVAAYPAYLVERHRDTAQALAELETVQVASLPRVLRRLDPHDLGVAARLGETFERGGPRARLAAALALAPVRQDCRDSAFDRCLDAPPEDVVVVARLLSDHMPDLLTRLEAELAPRDVADKDREARDIRRANAAVALIALGRPQPGYGLLRFDPNPQARSFLVHRLGPAGIAPGGLFGRLKQEPDLSIRRALILALGEVPDAKWDEPLRNEVERWLLDRYEFDPDSGIHGAAKWLLGRWSDRPGGERLAARRRSIDDTLAGAEHEGFGWRISKRGLTFIRVKQHDGSLVEIADTEITVGLFLAFDEKHTYLREPCPTEAHPMNSVSYEQATALCRWLSREEGLPPDHGYDLPTLADFVAASRAGARTSRFYGDTPALLASYARYKPGGVVLAAPVGSLKPNDLGLFDTLGNVSDLCFNPDGSPPHQTKAVGGSAAHSSFNVACDLGETNPDSFTMPDQGFRVARSLSPTPP